MSLAGYCKLYLPNGPDYGLICGDWVYLKGREATVRLAELPLEVAVKTWYLPAGSEDRFRLKAADAIRRLGYPSVSPKTFWRCVVPASKVELRQGFYVRSPRDKWRNWVTRLPLQPDRSQLAGLHQLVASRLGIPKGEYIRQWYLGGNLPVEGRKEARPSWEALWYEGLICRAILQIPTPHHPTPSPGGGGGQVIHSTRLLVTPGRDHLADLKMLLGAVPDSSNCLVPYGVTIVGTYVTPVEDPYKWEAWPNLLVLCRHTEAGDLGGKRMEMWSSLLQELGCRGKRGRLRGLVAGGPTLDGRGPDLVATIQAAFCCRTLLRREKEKMGGTEEVVDTLSTDLAQLEGWIGRWHRSNSEEEWLVVPRGKSGDKRRGSGSREKCDILASLWWLVYQLEVSPEDLVG